MEKVLMEIGQIAELGATGCIIVMFVWGARHFITKYMPERDKMFVDKIDEVATNFAKALKEERDLHKSINKELSVQISKIQRNHSNFITAYIAKETSSPKEAREMYENLIENGD